MRHSKKGKNHSDYGTAWLTFEAAAWCADPRTTPAG
jgi:hypothetical protein